MDLTFGLKVEPKLEDLFLELGEVVVCVRDCQDFGRKVASLAPLRHFIPWT